MMLGAISGKNFSAVSSITAASFSSHVNATVDSGVVIGASVISMALLTIANAGELGSRYPNRLGKAKGSSMELANTSNEKQTNYSTLYLTPIFL